MTDADAIMIWLILYIAAGLGALIFCVVMIRHILKKRGLYKPEDDRDDHDDDTEK